MTSLDGLDHKEKHTTDCGVLERAPFRMLPHPLPLAMAKIRARLTQGPTLLGENTCLKINRPGQKATEGGSIVQHTIHRTNAVLKSPRQEPRRNKGTQILALPSKS